MQRPSIYRILELPLVYRLSQRILLPGAKRLLGALFAELFDQVSGMILDVGCGPRLTTPEPSGTLVGVDVNPRYLMEYAGKVEKEPLDPEASRGGERLAYLSTAEDLPFADDVFDEARCVALLHHLPDEAARQSVMEMLRCVKPGGRVVVIDAVWPRRAWRRPVAWLTRALDRGEWIRHENELSELVQSASPGHVEVRRATTTYTGLEALVLVTNKLSVK